MEQNQLANYLRMGRTTLNNIIKETCQAIWDTLQPEVLKVPSRHKWISKQTSFSFDGTFPTVLEPLMESMWSFKHLH